MNLNKIVKRIVEKNDEEYKKDSLVDDKLVISQDSIRKRVGNLYKEFLDKNSQFNKFPINKFSENEVEVLLEQLFWKIENGNQREIISNINKWNEGVDLSNLYFNQDYGFQEEIQLRKLKNRTIIRDYDIKSEDCIQLLLQDFLSIKNSRVLIDISFDALIQILTYRLYTATIYKTKEKRNISNKILRYHKSLTKELNDSIQNKDELELSIEAAFDIFLDYLDMMIIEKNYIRIMNILISDMEESKDNYKKVKPQYRTYKEQEAVESNIEEILCEGKKVNEFDRKLKETKAMINIFNRYGCRNCNTSKIQDLKVYFREIYLDDTKHSKRARKAMSIIRSYISELDSKDMQVKEFESLKDYLFIREKITRGYYRELGQIEEYKLRSKAYENIYELYSKLYFFYDGNKTIKACNEINVKLFRKIGGLLPY